MAPPTLADLGFPAWLRAAHWINVIFIGLLVRSGIQILSSYPRLYLGNHRVPGREWLKFTRKAIPQDRPWITLEQETNAPAWLAQPGGKDLGLGRHWHFASVIFWVLNGLVYVILLFATGEWQRLIPTSWSIFPDAWNTFLTYASFHLPPASASHPYDALQQLSYAAVVFLLGPFLILTGAAQSPAVAGRFPWYERLFGGRQTARSLHFLGLVAVIVFTFVHTVMVIVTDFGKNMGNITLGEGSRDQGLAIVIGLAIIATCLLIYALTTWLSRRQRRGVYGLLGALIHPPLAMLAHYTVSRQRYSRADVSPVFLVNGSPPHSERYELTKALGFADYHLEVCGLVARPLRLSLAQLRALPRHEQITLHHCIQGWSSVGAWTGAAFADILKQCEPTPRAQYVVFWSHSDDTTGRQFYEVIDLATLRHPQTLLAYQLNGEDLTVAHGAPLRLRAETLLGFKMVKWIERIEFVEEYASIREGQGGSREDNKEYEVEASV
jgi:thiosulfate reductase cytochrome b subunit